MNDLVQYLKNGGDASYNDSNTLGPIDKAILGLRRRGVGFDEIAENVGLEDRFAVIDRLNKIYKNLRPINVEEARDSAEAQIDDLITVYQERALTGDLKAAAFILKALELRLKIRGGITPPQLNVQINNQKPWEKVYGTVLSPTDKHGNVLEGEVVEGDDF